MGLLDDLRQYVSDAMPGGLLNPEVTKKSIRGAGEAMSMMPNPAGDVASGLLAIDDVRQGNYGDAALNGIGVLPFIPALGGAIKQSTKSEILRYLSSPAAKNGTPIDPHSVSEFADDAIYAKPLGERFAAGEYNPRKAEVLNSSDNGMLHFSEPDFQKGYKMHRFVKEAGGQPVAQVKVIEFPASDGYVPRPNTATLKYAYTKESERGKGHAKSLLEFADGRISPALRPDYLNTDEMLRLLRSYSK